MTWEEAIEQRLLELDEFLKDGGELLTQEEVKALAPSPPSGAPDKLLDALAHKTILVALKKKLDDDPGWNQRFNATTTWQLLNKMLTAARLRELSRVRIVKRGKRGALRFDITELVSTYYGRQILAGLKFNVSRRRVVDKEEFATIQSALAKIKLTLPEAVEPTTTEKFFGDTGEAKA